MIDVSWSDADLVRYMAKLAAEHPRDPIQAAGIARALGASGSQIAFSGTRTADIASTGGPSSLSTLLCPLFLCATGMLVPKLGVPGRPAGGIDCLAQVRGYRTTLTVEDLRKVLEQCGYAHFIGGETYAPLDARIFHLRQQHGFQDVPVLVAASLLSKKLAVGVSMAGLDVRVARHGNFGRTFEEAKLNAQMYEQAATLLGISGRPVLTDGNAPYQAYIGRGEALAALAKIFNDDADSWLQEHIELCRLLCAEGVPEESDLMGRVSVEQIRQTFAANLAAQGASYDAFLDVAVRVAASHGTEISADQEGVVVVSLDGIRKALVAAQEQGSSGSNFPDPAGIILRRRPGETVRRGDTVATVRVADANRREDLVRQLKAAIRTSEAP
jgi:pyrimidine-nucleoside phosphorylase